MRLKILFFPLMLILSISVMLLYAWPQITTALGLKANFQDKSKELEGIKAKSVNIVKLNQDIDAHKTEAEFIKKYLPLEKNEERYINTINFITAESGLVITKLAFSKPTASQSQTTVQQVPLTSLVNEVPVEQQTQVATSPIDLVSANIGIVGSYDNIQRFLQQIDYLDVYHKVREVNISKGETNDLEASVVIDLGFMKEKRSGKSLTSTLFDKNSFDYTNINSLQNSINTKVPSIEYNSVGKNNPFIP